MINELPENVAPLTVASPCSSSALRSRQAGAVGRWLMPLLLGLLSACAGGANTFTQTGQASYYADKFNGRKTASGTIYRPGKRTAAHNTLPFGTVVRVTNPRNHRSVKVTITDRGPHAKGRVIDLSKKAARKIGIIDAGVAPVQLKVIKKG